MQLFLCLQSLFFGWNSYFDKNIILDEKFENRIFTQGDNLTPKNGHTHVFNCYFHDFNSKTGAISYSKQGSNFLVEKCYFINISANSHAAISVFEGNFVIAFTCGQKCFAQTNDGFSTAFNDETRKINFAFDSSVSFCETKTYFIMAHDYGIIHIKSVNLSNNKAKTCCALICQPSLNDPETGFGSEINFCSFSNNTATNERCIAMRNAYNKSCSHRIKNSNVIGNKANKTVFSCGNTNIYLSLFINNDNSCFSTENINDRIILTLCYIDEIDFVSISQNNSQISDPLLLSLPSFETGFCIHNFHFCTKNGFLQNIYFKKIITTSPFLFILFSKTEK